ncbi:MAG: hypothetical protein ACREYE_06130, partial [Gammaproteobacteria bacterium]
AYQKVSTGQGGAEAGREGPTPIALNVQPQALVDEKPLTLQGAIEKFVVDAVAQNQNRHAQGMPPTQVSRIQVVSE